MDKYCCEQFHRAIENLEIKYNYRKSHLQKGYYPYSVNEDLLLFWTPMEYCPFCGAKLEK
jgi:hypothetical protein